MYDTINKRPRFDDAIDIICRPRFDDAIDIICGFGDVQLFEKLRQLYKVKPPVMLSIKTKFHMRYIVCKAK